MIEYNKLIRDKIPEIIEQSGKKCIVEVMDNDTYIEYLDQKLNEELERFQREEMCWHIFFYVVISEQWQIAVTEIFLNEDNLC